MTALCRPLPAFVLCACALLASMVAEASTERFVDATTARRLVDAEGATVLDARGVVAFVRGHIDGATRFDWSEESDAALTGGRVSDDVEALARRFADAGVDDARPVLVCGDGASGWGEEARVAWTLDLLGKRNVHVLDGGCVAWREAGFPWAFGLGSKAQTGDFTARPNSAARATKGEVVRAIADQAALILDVRSREEFDGATPYGERRGGHLPRAMHLDWRRIYGVDSRLLRGQALRARLEPLGLLEGRSVIVYCTGGVRSALVTEVLRANGVNARNYDGSMWEWAADESLPLE